MKLIKRILTSTVGLILEITLVVIGIYYLTGFAYILLLPVIAILYVFIRSVVNLFKEGFKTMKVITIKKNRRRGEWRFIPFIYLGLKTRVITYRFNFASSCLYNLPYNPNTDEENDNGDINKLIGFSHLHVHRNSQRFGWNCNWNEQKINIFSYFYKNKIRNDKLLQSINTKEDIEVTHILTKGLVRYYINDVFMCKNEIPKIIIGYKNFSYFGGTKKAPHIMQIFRTKLKNNSFNYIKN